MGDKTWFNKTWRDQHGVMKTWRDSFLYQRLKL